MIEIPANFIHATFFFTDIVSLSNPVLSNSTQISKIHGLNECISKCDTYKNTPEKDKVVLPTGDGMLIAFLNGLEKPINLSRELQKNLKEYNEQRNETEKIEIRIGCHLGDAFFVDVLQGQTNLWGSGSILAKRVMDFGDSDHILITSTLAESLIELSDDYKKIIHPLRDFQIKHGEVLLVYSVYDDSFGNPNRPKKGMVESNKTVKTISEKSNDILYNNIEMTLSLMDSQTRRMKFSKICEISNLSQVPIYEIVNEITTDVKKSISDLKIKIHDENDKEMKFGRISLDTDYKKEFSVKFNSPVLREDKKRGYTITYETEHPNNYFEDIMIADTDSYSMKFNFLANDENVHPKLYVSRYQDREKNSINLKKGIPGRVGWDKIKNLKEKDIIRLEW